MVPRKIIHCIGDSHTGFFTGCNKIQPEYPSIGLGRISNVIAYRIGAPLAFNLCERNTKSKSNEKLFEIVNKLNPVRDILLLSFGEIDCRAHLLKQAALQNRNLDLLLDECIERYMAVIRQLRGLGFIVCIWNAIPTAMGFGQMPLEYPYYGDYVERNKLTAKFNRKLIENQQKYDFQYYGVFEKVVLPDWSTNEKYYFDKIHLNNILLPGILKEIRLRNRIYYSQFDILMLKIRIFVGNKLNGKSKLFDKLLGIISKIRLRLDLSK